MNKIHHCKRCDGKMVIEVDLGVDIMDYFNPILNNRMSRIRKAEKKIVFKKDLALSFVECKSIMEKQ